MKRGVCLVVVFKWYYSNALNKRDEKFESFSSLASSVLAQRQRSSPEPPRRRPRPRRPQPPRSTPQRAGSPAFKSKMFYDVFFSKLNSHQLQGDAVALAGAVGLDRADLRRVLRNCPPKKFPLHFWLGRSTDRLV